MPIFLVAYKGLQETTVQDRYINEIHTTDDLVPIKDRYVYGDTSKCSDGYGGWYGNHPNSFGSTRSAEYLALLLSEPTWIKFKCKHEARKWLGLEKWPDE